MKSEYEIKETAKAIISFTDSYAQNMERKQNEQQDSESISSPTDMVSTLRFLYGQIWNNNTSKFVIQIPKLLQSLVALSRFKVGIHIREEIDLLRLKVRHQSRQCLDRIQQNGDEQIQADLVNIGYGRVMSITYSTAGGISEEQDKDIFNGLMCISRFLRELHEGRNDRQTSFQPLPLLARITVEQIEKEGANEELEAQMKNNGCYGSVQGYANEAKAATLNCFIHNN
ncbi:MAG: hypothetical protein EZS28_037528 [Streblomastix strix]|uniref:Uncharacterized protein n=1 Tax=Streblomastix strix TaxID=222440 RepID=A0A5J4UBE0_9EUKA|nr:MAG: hypothetical protein EZS28_037528 [Streblomastix strix]